MFLRIYVCETNTPGYYYVGTTLRLPHHREREHRLGHGSRFTSKHGFRRFVFMELIEPGTGVNLEDDLTLALMARFGWGAVRGGNFVALHEHTLRRWLPAAFRDLGPRDVLPLHLRPVSKFPAELRRLLNRFEVVRGLEHTD